MSESNLMCDDSNEENFSPLRFHQRRKRKRIAQLPTDFEDSDPTIYRPKRTKGTFVPLINRKTPFYFPYIFPDTKCTLLGKRKKPSSQPDFYSDDLEESILLQRLGNEVTIYSEEKRRRKNIDEDYFLRTNNNISHHAPDVKNINELFDRYVEVTSVDEIKSLGLVSLRSDMGINTLYSFKYFSLMYILNCSSKYKITRTEWLLGLYYNNVDTMEKLELFLSNMRNNAYVNWSFDKVKKFFTFVFRLLLDSPQSKLLNYKIALNALHCLMSISYINHNTHNNNIRNNASYYSTQVKRQPVMDNGLFFLNICIKYYKDPMIEKKIFKYINLDQFKIFYDFSLTIKKDFSNFNVVDCWPTMFDELFVWYKSKYLMTDDGEHNEDSTSFEDFRTSQDKMLIDED